MNNICCSFGHRDYYGSVKQCRELEKAVTNLVKNKLVDTFYTGGMGGFDRAFSSAVKKVKIENPHIELILIKPYFTKELYKNKSYYETFFDGVLLPECVEGLHYKSAIHARNRWMAEQSRYIIGYVRHEWGGAAASVKYAKKLGREIILIGEESTKR